jgi:O-antigen/teichoic acid export membrane protein
VTPSDTSNLKHKAVRGGAFTFASQWTRFVLRIASTAILSRLLEKDDFGLVAMVTAFTGFASLFADAGLTQAAMRAKVLSREQASTLFWINLAVATVVAIVVIACSPLIALFYGKTELTLIACVTSSALIAGALGAQHVAMLQRELRFGRLAVAETVGNVSGVAIGITLAALGAGYWALVVQVIATSAITSIGAWLATGWRPMRPAFAPGTRDLLTSGSHLSGTEVLNYIGVNADSVVIGKFAGEAPLGEYSRAQGLLLMPLTQIIGPFTKVAVPLLSRLQDQPERFARAYYKMVALVALVSTPLIAVLMVGARDIVLIMLGPKFADAAQLFQILAIAAWGMPVVATTTWVAIATGQTKALFWRNLIRVVVFVAAFLVGVQWSAVGVAWAYVIATHALRVPMTWWTLSTTPVSLRGLTKSTWIATVIGVLGAAAMVGPAYFLPVPATTPTWLSPWITLTATLLAGAAVMGSLTWFWPRARREFLEAIDLVRSARRGRPINEANSSIADSQNGPSVEG